MARLASKGETMKRVTEQVLRGNENLLRYLSRGEIKPAKRGGAFVGSYDIAPEQFGQYGIILPKGGMIIPEIPAEDLCAMVQKLRQEKILEAQQVKQRAEQEKQDADQKIANARLRLLGRVQEAYSLLERNAGETWRLQAMKYGQEAPSNGYKSDEIVAFPSANRVGLLGPSSISDTSQVFEWTDKDINQLTEIIGEWLKAAQPRRDLLWGLFVKANGVVTMTQEKKSYFEGHSLATGKARWDDVIEVRCFVGGEEITDREHGWLKSRIGELEMKAALSA